MKNNHISKYPKIRLGLCCSILSLRYRNNIYSSRRKNLKTIFRDGLYVAKDVAKENVIDLVKMIFWAKNHGIDVMRISSELVPHGNNIEIVKHFGKNGEKYISLEFLKPFLKIVGKIAKLEKIRLTFHPGQFVQIGTPKNDVFQATVRELEMHTKFLNLMEMDVNSVIVIHIGGTYCNKKQTIKKFIERFRSLPKNIKKRMVLENDEKCYDVDEVLEICNELNVPFVLDIFHYYCYGKLHPEKKQVSLEKIIPDILKTWTERGIRPKFHLSEQMEGKPIGSHSLFIKKIPELLLNIWTKYNIEIDIMIEAKGKEVAISKLYKKYPFLKPNYKKELPKIIPKEYIKDIKLPEKIKEKITCEC